MTASTHREQYRIRSAEVDTQGRATVTAIANLLQEAAASGARRLGVAVEHLRPDGLTWYLARLHLELRRPPWIGETVEIETWPAGIVRAHFVRDFRLFLDGGIDAVEIGRATTGWLLVDLESGKPKRKLPESMRALKPDPPHRAIDSEFPRLPDPADLASAAERPFPLRRTDLDLNGHVNYGILVDALMEAVPAELWDDGELHELEVDFRGEARPGDALHTRSYPVEDAEDDDAETLLHGVVRQADGREIVRARSRWLRIR